MKDVLHRRKGMHGCKSQEEEKNHLWQRDRRGLASGKWVSIDEKEVRRDLLGDGDALYLDRTLGCKHLPKFRVHT